MNRSAVYLGDFLSTLQSTGVWRQGMPFPDDGAAMTDIAAACGFQVPVFADRVESDLEPPPQDEQTRPRSKQVPPPEPLASKDGQPARARRLEFWHVAGKHDTSDEELAGRRKVPDFVLNAPVPSNADWEFEWKPAPGRSLLPWKRLWPFLKGVLGTQRHSQQIDLPQTVKKLALAAPLRRFPQRQRPAWQARATLLVDYRSALGPFWDDYDRLIRRLSALRGKLGLSVVRAHWAGSELWDARKKRLWRPPGTGTETAILALGDLSQYCSDQSEFQQWLRLGRKFKRQGLRPWALCPCPRDRWDAQMSRAWALACWDHGQRLPLARARRGLAARPALSNEQSDLQALRERQLLDLLRLVSPAILVERGLLRDLRVLLAQAADAGTEYDAFQSADFTGSESARKITPRLLMALRRELMDTDKVPLPLFVCAVRLILNHHQHSQAVFGAQEWDGILDLATPEHCRALEQVGLLHDGVWDSIRLHWEKLAAGLLRQSYGEHQAAMISFAGELVGKLQEGSLNRDGCARQAKEIIWTLHQANTKKLASWVRPESIEFMHPEQDLKVQALSLREGLQLDSWLEEGTGVLGVIQGHRMTLGLFAEGTHPMDSFHAERDWTAGTLLSAEELHRASRVTLNAGEQRLVLEKMCRPLWADRLYYDSRGLVADVDLQGEKRSLRWHLPSHTVPETDQAPPQPTLIDIRNLISEIAGGFQRIASAKGNRFKLKWIVSDDRLKGWMDRKALSQIIIELVYNAIRHTPPVGSVALSAVVNHYQLKIEVRDTGMGIGAEVREHIFEQGFRSKAASKADARGLGIGLAVVLGLTRAMGGEATITSLGKGSGTTACVTLPWPSTREAAEAVYRKANKENEAKTTGSFAAKVLPVSTQGKGGWHAESKPSWATRLWADDYGLAAEFRIKDVPFTLRWIPPGSFLMGSPEDEPGRDDSEGPLHQVDITQGYWIGETQVTQAQWRTVVEEAGRWQKSVSHLDPTPSHFQGPVDLPVESVSWEDSVTFCRLLNALLPDGPGFQLPTEAQWEYACRLGSSKAPFLGPLEIVHEVLSPELDPFAWYAGNCSERLEITNLREGQSRPKQRLKNMRGGTHRVRGKLPNTSGLFDMLGNVWEWCRDAWDPFAYVERKSGVSDPCSMVPDERRRRVARGGSWQNEAPFCRVAMRNWDIPEARSSNQGIRLSAGRKELGALEPEQLQDSKSLINFSPRAQQVLSLARKEADRLGNEYVGVEHLVLGLIKVRNGIGWKVLQRAMPDLDKVRTEMEKLCGPPKEEIPSNIPYTPRVKTVLALSSKEATAFGNDYVGTEHILLGVLREGVGRAAHVLLSLGLSLDQCREEIMSEGYLRAEDEGSIPR